MTKPSEPIASTVIDSTNGHLAPLKVCAYARSAMRKTLQIAHLVDMVGAANVLVVSAEEGLSTIASKLTVPDNVVKVASLAEFREKWPAVKRFAGWTEVNGKGAYTAIDPVRWIAIDGGSQIADWVGNEQLANADAYYEFHAKGLADAAPAHLKPYRRYIARDGELNTMQIYGRIGRDMENMLAAWKTLPVNLYANFWEDMTMSDGFKASPPWGPDVPGKVGLKAVIGAFDYVTRLTLDQNSHLCAQFEPSPMALCKTREDQFAGVVIPPVITDFRLDTFIRLVQPRTNASSAPINA